MKTRARGLRNGRRSAASVPRPKKKVGSLPLLAGPAPSDGDDYSSAPMPSSTALRETARAAEDVASRVKAMLDARTLKKKKQWGALESLQRDDDSKRELKYDEYAPAERRWRL